MSFGFLAFEFFYVSTIATLNHFAYDISHHMFIFSLIAAVNESIWEHEKMGVIPWLSWFAIKKFWFGMEVNFMEVFLANFFFINTITIIFLSYTHFTKHYVVPIDISSFYIAIGMGMWAEHLCEGKMEYNTLGLIGTLLLLFVVFKNTYYPWKVYYFLDEGVKKYGMDAHPERCMLKSEKDKNNQKKN